MRGNEGTDEVMLFEVANKAVSYGMSKSVLRLRLFVLKWIHLKGLVLFWFFKYLGSSFKFSSFGWDLNLLRMFKHIYVGEW